MLVAELKRKKKRRKNPKLVVVCLKKKRRLVEFMILGIVDIDHLAEFSTLFGMYFVQGLYQFMPVCVSVRKGLECFLIFSSVRIVTIL